MFCVISQCSVHIDMSKMTAADRRAASRLTVSYNVADSRPTRPGGFQVLWAVSALLFMFELVLRCGWFSQSSVATLPSTLMTNLSFSSEVDYRDEHDFPSLGGPRKVHHKVGHGATDAYPSLPSTGTKKYTWWFLCGFSERLNCFVNLFDIRLRTAVKPAHVSAAPAPVTRLATPPPLVAVSSVLGAATLSSSSSSGARDALYMPLPESVPRPLQNEYIGWLFVCWCV